MRGIILHGGAGTRLRPLTFGGPKQLIPVANKPVSQYVLEDLVASGVSEIAIVLGETFPELVREHYGDGTRFEAQVTYIVQGKPLGIAHAVRMCKDFVQGDKLVVCLGDNLFQFGIKQYLDDFLRFDYDAMVLFKEVEDPRRFGVPKFDEEGKLVGLIEKPKEPPSNYAIVGVYFFKPVIFDMIDRLKPSWREEYEITEALQMLIDEGYKVGYGMVNGWWLDTGKKDEILHVNALILDEHVKRDIKGELVRSTAEGRVCIEEGSKAVGSTIRGPTTIGKNCLIENSLIGPYTSIGDGAHIVDSSLEYCVILENALIEGVERLEESLVGRNAKILRNEKHRRIKLHISDYSEVEM